jgi:alanine racemase
MGRKVRSVEIKQSAYYMHPRAFGSSARHCACFSNNSLRPSINPNLRPPVSYEPLSPRCWAEIDRAALQHNLAAVRSQVGPSVKVMAVIKANAYGHGATHVAKALAESADVFGVANVAEAREARTCAPAVPVLILGPALPEERAEIVAYGFIPLISTMEEARAFHALAGKNPVEAHLAIDTGMGRVGIWENEALAVAAVARKLPGLRITGICSHLPVADEDAAFTREQLASFQETARRIRALGFEDSIVHIENSAGLIGFPAQAGDLVRAGLMLYGSSPLPEFQSRLLPVMTWKTRITLVRTAPAGHGISYGRTHITRQPTRIATLAVGYADGYQRHLSNRDADVLIRGHRCPVLGRITMDQIVVDVNAAPTVTAGEEAVLLGRQEHEEIPAAELAEKSGTIPWEIFTGVGRRVERVCL